LKSYEDHVSAYEIVRAAILLVGMSTILVGIHSILVRAAILLVGMPTILVGIATILVGIATVMVRGLTLIVGVANYYGSYTDCIVCQESRCPCFR
jgi:hypothetical protein